MIQRMTVTRKAMSGVDLAGRPFPELGLLLLDILVAALDLLNLRFVEKYMRKKENDEHEDHDRNGEEHPLEERNLDFTNFSIMAMPIRFGGVPTGVPIPPTEEA